MRSTHLLALDLDSGDLMLLMRSSSLMTSCSHDFKRAISDFMVVGEAFGFDESNMGKAWSMREFGVLKTLTLNPKL